MLKISLMIEGQNGLNWPRWKKIVVAAEELGFFGLYRSDHFTNSNPPDMDSLELWVSLTWLAANTNRIRFGPLVSPLSFRHPVMTARMAAAVDNLSNGRLVLGLGAGWQEREHDKFGFDLLPISERFTRFEEGLRVISLLMQNATPVSFQGNYYRLHEAILLPRPARAGGPPILIGGVGEKRTLPLVARYASEWNAVFISKFRYIQLNQRLDELMSQVGRSPMDVRRSMMNGCIFARNKADLEKKLSQRRHSFEEYRQNGTFIGESIQIADQITEFEDTGAREVMLQWLDLDDLDGLEQMAKALLK